MSWSADFLDAIRQPVVRPRYLLESIALDSEPKAYGGSLRLSSFRASGYTEAIAATGHQLSPGILRPGAWSLTYGSWSIALTPAAAPQRSVMARGQVVALRVGFSDDPAEFETVRLGVIRNLTMRGGQWVLSIVDVEQALISRFSSTDTAVELFAGLDETTVGSAYTAGDSSITLTTGAGFAADPDGLYWLEITKDDGDTVIMSATGKASGVFSGLSAGLLGTTDGDAAAGNAAREVGHMLEHPLRVAQAILTSTGGGTNGAWDLLPASWSYGVGVDLIAEDDIQVWVDELIGFSTGGDGWDVHTSSSQANGISWLQGVLQTGGMFVTQWQGRITCRGVPDVYGSTTPGELSIGDDTIVAVTGYDTWDPALPVQYGAFRATPGSGSAASETGSIIARPAVRRRDWSVPYAFSGGGSWATDVANRLGPWDVRVPERIRLRVAGWLPAVAAPGDVIRLSTSLITPRHSDLSYRDGRRCLVLQSAPQWWGAYTDLTLAVLPTAQATE